MSYRLDSVLRLRQSPLFRVLFGFLLHGFRGVYSVCVPTQPGSCFAGLSSLCFCSFSTSLHSLCLLVVLLALSLSDHFVLPFRMCHSPVFPFTYSRFSSFFRFFVRFWSFSFFSLGAVQPGVGSWGFSLGQVVSAGAVV